VKKQRLSMQLGETSLAYSLFQKNITSENSSPRRILLLHGAGVAGELTWTFIANYLEHWDEILIPDLLGMGDSFFEPTDTLAFTIADINQSLFSMLRHHAWHEFDLAGYSLGGLVALELNREIVCEYSHDVCLSDLGKDISKKSIAEKEVSFNVNKLCLIEPALFSDQSLRSALAFRETFTPVANNIKAEPNNAAHFMAFLDLVSPHRKRNENTDAMAIRRLQVRPFGFANALAAVSHYAKTLDEVSLNRLLDAVPEGVGIVGGLSNAGLILAQQNIQQHQANWQIEQLDNADHSLVYVRPKQVARIMNEFLF
jgi:pimeloyl-ACP methyl ester carboxylesterase